MKIFFYHIFTNQSRFTPDSNITITLVGVTQDSNIPLSIVLNDIPRVWFAFPADNEALEEAMAQFPAVSISLISGQSSLPAALAHHPRECEPASQWLKFEASRHLNINPGDTLNMIYYQTRRHLVHYVPPADSAFDDWLRQAPGLAIPGWFDWPSVKTPLPLKSFLADIRPVVGMEVPKLKICWLNVDTLTYTVRDECGYTDGLIPGDDLMLPTSMPEKSLKPKVDVAATKMSKIDQFVAALEGPLKNVSVVIYMCENGPTLNPKEFEVALYALRCAQSLLGSTVKHFNHAVWQRMIHVIVPVVDETTDEDAVRTRLASALFESRITGAPWQIALDVESRQSKKVQWFLARLMHRHRYIILPDQSNPTDTYRYAGGYNDLAIPPGVYIAGDTEFIAQLDIFGCYPTIIAEMNLCLTRSDLWTSQLSPAGQRVAPSASAMDALVTQLIDQHIHRTMHKDKNITPLAAMTIKLLALRRQCKLKGNRALMGLVMAIKLLLNSMYGTFAFRDGTFYVPILATIITGVGRAWIKELADSCTRLLRGEILLSITDCVVARIGGMSATERQPAQVLKPLATWIQKRFDHLSVDLDQFYRAIVIQAKGKYAARRYDDDKAPILVRGFESRHAKWCPWAATIIDRVLLWMLQGQSLAAIVQQLVATEWACSWDNIDNYTIEISRSDAEHSKMTIVSMHRKRGLVTWKDTGLAIVSAHKKRQSADAPPIDEKAWKSFYLEKQVYTPLVGRILPLMGAEWTAGGQAAIDQLTAAMRIEPHVKRPLVQPRQYDLRSRWMALVTGSAPSHSTPSPPPVWEMTMECQNCHATARVQNSKNGRNVLVCSECSLPALGIIDLSNGSSVPTNNSRDLSNQRLVLRRSSSSREEDDGRHPWEREHAAYLENVKLLFVGERRHPLDAPVGPSTTIAELRAHAAFNNFQSLLSHDRI